MDTDIKYTGVVTKCINLVDQQEVTSIGTDWYCCRGTWFYGCRFGRPDDTPFRLPG